jgi:hypothetical protein
VIWTDQAMHALSRLNFLPITITIFLNGQGIKNLQVF